MDHPLDSHKFADGSLVDEDKERPGIPIKSPIPDPQIVQMSIIQERLHASMKEVLQNF